jgi:YEATS domain-containing protein 4
VLLRSCACFIHPDFGPVFGSIATKLPEDPAQRPSGLPAEHSHRWTVYVRGVDGADITYWLRKVQFKLHDTYAQPLRMIEAPAPFEVTETGWGEFEVGIKLTFVPESGEKPASVYHQLKLHPWGENAEAVRVNNEPVISECFEEVVFNEPSEAFYDILTNSHPPQVKGKNASKSAKLKKGGERTAEIPEKEAGSNPYSVRAEMRELDRLAAAVKQVDGMLGEEKTKLAEREIELEELRKSEGVVKPK